MKLRRIRFRWSLISGRSFAASCGDSCKFIVCHFAGWLLGDVAGMLDRGEVRQHLLEQEAGGSDGQASISR